MKRRFSGESVEQPDQEANDVLSGGSPGGLSINNLGDQLGLDDPLKAEVIEFVRQEMPAGISWGFFVLILFILMLMRIHCMAVARWVEMMVFLSRAQPRERMLGFTRVRLCCRIYSEWGL